MSICKLLELFAFALVDLRCAPIDLVLRLLYG